MTSDVIELDTAMGLAPVSHSCRLTTLFDAHHQRLYRLARRLVATGDEAQDLVQETFLRAARAPHAVPDGTSSAEAWLVRILVNLCRDRWRRRAFRSRVTSERSGDFQTRTGSDQETVYIAQADLKDFLPYKSYRLLATQWMLGSGKFVARLRGEGPQEYDLEMAVHERYALWPFAPAARTDAEIVEKMGLQRTRVGIERFALRETGARPAPVVERTAGGGGSFRGGGTSFAYVGLGAIIDTSFTMDVGETVVVGTSRLQGDKALIVLLTAVAK